MPWKGKESRTDCRHNYNYISTVNSTTTATSPPGYKQNAMDSCHVSNCLMSILNGQTSKSEVYYMFVGVSVFLLSTSSTHLPPFIYLSLPVHLPTCLSVSSICVSTSCHVCTYTGEYFLDWLIGSFSIFIHFVGLQYVIITWKCL